MKIVRVGQGVMLVFAAILAAYGAARAQALNDIQDATQPKQKSVTFVNDTSAAAAIIARYSRPLTFECQSGTAAKIER